MTIDNCQFCHSLSQFVTRTVFKRQIQTFWESGPEILCYTGPRCAVCNFSIQTKCLSTATQLWVTRQNSNLTLGFNTAIGLRKVIVEQYLWPWFSYFIEFHRCDLWNWDCDSVQIFGVAHLSILLFTVWTSWVELGATTVPRLSAAVYQGWLVLTSKL